MDSKLYIHRAENEIKLAGIIFAISEEPIYKKRLSRSMTQRHIIVQSSHIAIRAYFMERKHILQGKELKSLLQKNIKRHLQNSKNLLKAENLMLNF